MLLIHDGHFDVITKLPGFFYSNYYCLECESRCRDYELFKHTEKPDLPCKDCGRHFYGVTCQLNHLTLKANGQLVAPLEKFMQITQKMFYLLTCVHIYSTRTRETLRNCNTVPAVPKKSTFYDTSVTFNPSRMKRKRKERMKKNNTLYLFILILKRNKTQETM